MRWTPKSKLPPNRWPGMRSFYTFMIYVYFVYAIFSLTFSFKDKFVMFFLQVSQAQESAAVGCGHVGWASPSGGRV